MKHRLIALGLLASAVGLAQAQSTRQLYLVKGKKVVATFPASDVDFITFDGTQQFYLSITLKQGEGTTIVMYNASDDWDKDPAERKFDQLAGQPVKFVWYSDYGFDGTLKITSASGDDVPYEYVTDDEDFGSCWLCIMPAEPITIETVGKEKTTFAPSWATIRASPSRSAQTACCRAQSLRSASTSPPTRRSTLR